MTGLGPVPMTKQLLMCLTGSAAVLFCAVKGAAKAKFSHYTVEIDHDWAPTKVQQQNLEDEATHHVGKLALLLLFKHAWCG